MNNTPFNVHMIISKVGGKQMDYSGLNQGHLYLQSNAVPVSYISPENFYEYKYCVGDCDRVVFLLI